MPAWDHEYPRATRQGPLVIAPSFDVTFNRFVSWDGRTPQSIAILIDTRVSGIFNSVQSSAGFLAGLPENPTPGTIAGRVTARYGWGAYGTTLTWDLKPGTFALPACGACELGVQLVMFPDDKDQLPNKAPSEVPQEVGQVGAAIVPYTSGGPCNPITYTHRVPVHNDGNSVVRLESVRIPPRAVSYRAWMTFEVERNEHAEALVTRGPGGVREWVPGANEQAIGPTLGDRIESSVRNVQPEQRYSAFLEFRLAP